MCSNICFFNRGGYCLRSNTSISYSVSKVKKFLLDYWIVLFLLMGVSVFNGYRPTFQGVLLEMFGLKLYVMRFCWYVSFYIVLMFVLPIYAQVIKKKQSVKWDIGISIAFCIAAQLLVKIVETIDEYKVMQGLAIYLPVALMGYLFSKYDILKKINVNIHCTKISGIITGILLICVSLIIHGIKPYIKGISVGIIAVPILMEGIALTQISEVNCFGKVVRILGKQSMNIWFLHCIFFSLTTREIFQPVAYIFRNPFLVVTWILFLCTMASFPIEKLQKEVLKKMYVIKSALIK